MGRVYAPAAGALDRCFSHVTSLAPLIPKPVLYFFPSPGLGVHFDFFAGGTTPHPGSPGLCSGFHHGTSGFGSGIYPGSLGSDSGFTFLLGGTGSFVPPACGGSPGLGMGFLPGPGSSGLELSVALLIGGSGSFVACGFGFFSLSIYVPPPWELQSVSALFSSSPAASHVGQTITAWVREADRRRYCSWISTTTVILPAGLRYRILSEKRAAICLIFGPVVVLGEPS